MPDEPQCCEHDYRRDVETCPYCDLNEAEAALIESEIEASWLTRKLNEALKERDRLQRALEKYGDHRLSCDWDTKWAVCTCGLQAALDAKEEPGDHGEPPGQEP
jgi:hypothetical protein